VLRGTNTGGGDRISSSSSSSSSLLCRRARSCRRVGGGFGVPSLSFRPYVLVSNPFPTGRSDKTVIRETRRSNGSRRPFLWVTTSYVTAKRLDGAGAKYEISHYVKIVKT